MDSNEAPVLVQRQGHITLVTLNRPRAINALTPEMLELVRDAIETANTDGSHAIVLRGAGERGFCGGGDIKHMSAHGAKHGPAFIEQEYELDLLTHTSTVPVIGFMDGITMGGGIGLTAHAAIRLVTERSRLAMPETRIGIVPDVGGHLLLARAPGRLGEYLATSSASMNAADAIALGFADYMIDSQSQDALVSVLAERGDSRGSIDAIIYDYRVDAGDSPLLEHQATLDALISAALPPVTPQLTEDPHALAAWAIAGANHLVEEAKTHHLEYAGALREVSPTSVVVTLAQLHRTRALGLTLEQVLADDLRVLTRLFTGDFGEGVRARVIDKDNAPAWNPATFAALDAAVIAEIIDPA